MVRKWVSLGLLVSLMLMMSACSRSLSPVQDSQATPIDFSPQQTLTALSLSGGADAATSIPENSATPSQPVPLATEPAGETAADATATESPSATPTNSPTAEIPENSSTGGALIVTQTITPVNIPPSDGSGGQWTIAYLDKAPTIDGDFGDWPGVIYAVDKVVFGREFYANEIDLFGEFKLGWDNQYLYLGVLVRDSRFVQTASGALLFQGDSIEVLLDADRGGDLGTDQLNADDYQLGFSTGNLTDISLPEAYLWAPTDREGPMQMSLVKGRLTDDGYMVEIAIAWQELGVFPAAGTTLGFLLSISDNDSIGKNEQQTVISISETRNLTNPTTWIPVVLATP